MSRRVVVVGGGVAGTTAALSLADRGWQVTLLERRPRLGGAAYSFERDGHPVDTGQHVLLRCYDAYREHLDRLDAAGSLRWQQRMCLPVLGETGQSSRLRRSRLPWAPWHLAPALLGYRLLPAAARARVAVAMAAMRRLDPEDAALDGHRLGQWLREHGQRPLETEAVWGLLTVAALNTDVETASLALAVRVIRTALLEHPAAADVGVLRVPLSQVHDRAARTALDRAGVRTQVRAPATGLERRADGFRVHTHTGETDADAVVVAVPHRHAAALVPAWAAPGRETWSRLGSSPIVNVHVRYDRPVTDLAFAATLDPAVPWFFDRTEVVGGPGQYLATSLSAADGAVAEPARKLVARTTAALARLLPDAATARVSDAFVTREPHATFRQEAGTASFRPPAATAVPGLVLAGAWTATGWPDTLEGAARSGLTAADLLDGRVPAPTTSRRTRPTTRIATPTTPTTQEVVPR